MKKKNLIILLIIPFIISALTIVTVNMSYNLIDVDISHIKWNYDEIEAFQIGHAPFKLAATGVNNRNYQVAEGNNLVWRVQNKDPKDEEPCAEIIKKGDTYYLNALKNGEAIITCSNSKGNVSRSFTAIMYSTGVAYITTLISQSNYGKVDQTNYFGQYDIEHNFDNTSKKDVINRVKASFDVQMVVIPASMLETISVEAHGVANLDMNTANANVTSNKATVDGKITIDDAGEIYINLTSTLEGSDITVSDYSATVIENGLNVYTFDDLLSCTNSSDEGEIAVLQRSFVAKASSYGNNEVSFGNVRSDGSIDNSFVEYISTEYNHRFIDQWNREVNDSSKQLSASVCVGLHVKKDIYGNGHMINFHNIAFPSQTINGVPTTASSDLFQGPLPFYTVGDPKGATGSDMKNMNLISAYGQDNIGMYVDGDGIMLNDIVVKNCEDVNSLEFLNTVGTVVEVHGTGIELRNMRLSNGRQVLRSYSNHRLVLNNCMLSNARNFLFMTGSNEYKVVNDKKNFTLATANSNINTTLEDYLNPTGEGNILLADYLDGTFGTEKGVYKSKADMKNALMTLQKALTDDTVKNQFKGSTEIHDCTFYRSGISAIALESLFNGPFLQNPNSPDNIAPFFALLNSTLIGVDFTPEKISGTSYPVKVNISGKTKFYDYKTWDEVDVSGLISESISKLLQEFLGKEGYSIDNIFPIKRLLKNKPFEYNDNGVAKVNIPIAFYGGGTNYSVVTTEGYDPEIMKHLNGATETKALVCTDVDILEEYLVLPPVNPSSLSSSGALNGILQGVNVDHNTLFKTVTLVTGFEPFRFAFAKDGYLCGEAPSMDEMQQNALSLRR